jgi:hypothetical protein
MPKSSSEKRQKFFEENAVRIGTCYSENRSVMKTAKLLSLPPQLVSYVVARITPGVVKDKIIAKWVENDLVSVSDTNREG